MWPEDRKSLKEKGADWGKVYFLNDLSSLVNRQLPALSSHGLGCVRQLYADIVWNSSSVF